MFRIHLLTGAAAPCLLLATQSAAQAQDALSITYDAATAPSWTGDIIVTGARETYTARETSAANRTDTPLIKVPQSVQVLTKALIQEQDRRTLGDALVNVSGVLRLHSSPERQTTSIRRTIRFCSTRHGGRRA